MDYAKLLVTVNKLISKNGRDIIFNREDRTSKDPDKPWRGPKLEADGGTPVVLATKGVFVPPNTVREFGITSLGEGTEWVDMMTLSQQIVIVPGTETDLRQFDKITDRGVDWGIKAIQILRPGALALLGFVGVRR